MMQRKPLRILQIGLGPLGRKMYCDATRRKSLEVVAAVDIDPQLIGRSLPEVCSCDGPEVRITESISYALRDVEADVVLLTTVSDLIRATPQIEEILQFGLPVVSTCEELSFPWTTAPDLAKRIDSLAKEKDVAVLGTGVNPGFLMDTLPAFLTSIADRVEKIHVNRYQDAQYRRVPFQTKIGAGLNPDAFARKKEEGTLRHVGLTESIHFIAHQLGWTLTRTQDLIQPVIAEKRMVTRDITVEPGHARGVRQTGRGYVNDEERITLTFQAAVGEPASYDEVIIHGNPPIHSRIEGGVNGDVATCAISLNACLAIGRALPGLRTMADMPLISWRA